MQNHEPEGLAALRLVAGFFVRPAAEGLQTTAGQTTLQRGGGILPRFTLDLRQDRATPECHDAVGILAIDLKDTIVSADIDIKGGMGNRFQHGIYTDQGNAERKGPWR